MIARIVAAVAATAFAVLVLWIGGAELERGPMSAFWFVLIVGSAVLAFFAAGGRK